MARGGGEGRAFRFVVGEAVTRVHHLAFRTSDPEALARFYEEIFLFPRDRVHADDRGVRAVWLRAGETLVMIERREPGEPPPDLRSMECLLFAIEEADLPAFRGRLAARGVAIEGSTRFSTYVRDPEGRRVGVSFFDG